MSKWNELKRLAEAQPNKEWSRDAEGRLSCSSGLRMYGVTGPQCVSDFEDWGFTREAASFIAAAKPAAIIELIAENERLAEEEAESTAVVDRLAKLLAGVSVAVRGPELPLNRHSYHDLPERVSEVVADCDRLRAELNALKEASHV